MANSHTDHSVYKCNPDQNTNSGMLEKSLPFLNDREGDGVPDALPFIVDAHVHLFPEYLFSSVWKWFDSFGWPIRYRMTSEEIINFLLARGVDHIVALHYAHKPGVARELNAYMAKICKTYPHVRGMATVFPGEEDAGSILGNAFDAGLKGLKLHCHVQCFDMNSGSMRDDRIMCGTDFPNLPYAWDREIKRLAGLNLSENTLARILGGNASEFYAIDRAAI